MSVWQEVKDGVTGHPVIAGVGVVAIVMAVYLYYKSGSSSSGSATPAYNFSYSVGPTAAQVAAGTAQQNQLQADQTAVSLANINAGVATTQSNNALAAVNTQSNNALLTEKNQTWETGQIGIAENEYNDNTAIDLATIAKG